MFVCVVCCGVLVCVIAWVACMGVSGWVGCVTGFVCLGSVVWFVGVICCSFGSVWMLFGGVVGYGRGPERPKPIQEVYRCTDDLVVILS